MNLVMILAIAQYHLKKRINNFIKNKKVIDIKYQSNISGYANEYTNDNDLLERALIIYKEDKND